MTGIEYAAQRDDLKAIVGVGWTENRSSAESDVHAWNRDGVPTTLVEREVGDARPVRHSLTAVEVEALLADHVLAFVDIGPGPIGPIIAKCTRCPGEFYGSQQADALRRHDVERIAQAFALVRDHYPDQMVDMFRRPQDDEVPDDQRLLDVDGREIGRDG